MTRTATKTLEVFLPLIKQAKKEDKLLYNQFENIAYLPTYFQNLIETDSLLSPMSKDFDKWMVVSKESYENMQTKTFDKVDGIENEELKNKVISNVIIKLKDFSTEGGRSSVSNDIPRLTFGIRDITISKTGMVKIGVAGQEKFYFKISEFVQNSKNFLAITVSENVLGTKFRHTSGDKMICHRILLVSEIRNHFGLVKDKKFVLELKDEFEVDGLKYFKLELIN